MKESGFIELARAIRESTSLVKIDLSKNSMTQAILQELFSSLSENYVLSEIRIDLKGKQLPFGFSSYTLLSMYDVFVTKESIDL